MKSNKRLTAPLFSIVGIYLCVLLAGFLAPYNFATQDRNLLYAAPSRLHFVDTDGRWHLRPSVCVLTERLGAFGVYDEDRNNCFPIHFFVRGSTYRFLGVFQSTWHFFGVESPARIFLLGSDGYGRDVFSRLLYGGQISLFSGLLAMGLSLLVGALLGTVAGYYGGWIDGAVMRCSELFLALPWLYLLFAIRAFLPLHISPSRTFLLLIAVIGLIGWARPARLIRGVVLSGKERGYVLAARGFGGLDFYLMRRHLLPQTYSVLLTQAALLIPQYILAEVTLSFLGLGVGEPVPSWGNMLSTLQQYDVLISYWWMWAPGLALIPVFLIYQLLGSALQASADCNA
ncbi:MAG TPA: ABC transporter permease [Candidatus Aquilonibacter sp.]|nr:ABC transporter permease [Candidatus Aquilonibacter sp.]